MPRIIRGIYKNGSIITDGQIPDEKHGIPVIITFLDGEAQQSGRLSRMRELTLIARQRTEELTEVELNDMVNQAIAEVRFSQND
ncbi:hypothetical protein H8E77_07195 [bacterium]|nr:hypothetical protein [bacterium]